MIMVDLMSMAFQRSMLLFKKKATTPTAEKDLTIGVPGNWHEGAGTF